MKIMTILGTRPEMIRMSRVVALLDKYCEQILVHTGQNYDPNLSDLFFRDLKLRQPDFMLDTKSETTMAQTGKILAECDKIMEKERPDKVLILGDTNSALSAYPAKRRGIPVYHLEAGNRCFDDKVPEEANRKIVDSLSEILLPYVSGSRDNLLREGYPINKIFTVGNPLFEVLEHYRKKIDDRPVLKKMKLSKGGYFLATLHRRENVTDPARLKRFVEAMNMLCEKYGKPIIWSVHPHTRDNLDKIRLKINKKIRTMDPVGFLDFVKLEKNALCVLSDSGTVPEECTMFGVPSVVLRDSTERPEIIEAGSSIVAGSDPDTIQRAVAFVLTERPKWTVPSEYRVPNVSDKVARIILGK